MISRTRLVGGTGSRFALSTKTRPFDARHMSAPMRCSRPYLDRTCASVLPREMPFAVASFGDTGVGGDGARYVVGGRPPAT